MNLFPVQNRPERRIAFLLLLSALHASDEVRPGLDSLFSRGDSSIAVTWTPDSVNTRLDWYHTYGTTCTGADSIYRRCDFIPGKTYRSVAYSYGGEDGCELFRNKLERGFLAGSHMCHYESFGDPSAAVAGTDCSGFVCHLWGVPRVSTKILQSGYLPLDRGQLDAGDILVKPGSHAVVIIEKEDSTRFLIWESTSVVNGCRERLIDLSDTYWDSYHPRRNPAINSGIVEMSHGAESRCPHIVFNDNRIVVRGVRSWSGSISLYSLLGKHLTTAQVRTVPDLEAGLRVPDGSAGIYMIRVRSSSGAVSSYIANRFR